jgi:hypothetical protein
MDNRLKIIRILITPKSHLTLLFIINLIDTNTVNNSHNLKGLYH